MARAAAACEAVAFHGQQVDAWRGTGGATASVVEVWHQPGHPVVVQYSGAAGPASAARAADALSDQAGVMTITAPLLALMRQNYVITYAGTGSAGGRPARVIAVRRPGGGLAARYWLDTATGLPLRRELFGTRGAIFSDDDVVQLSLGTGQPGAMPPADASAWAGQLTAAGRAALRAAGWPLPGPVVGGLALFAATRTSTKSGQVVELSYSDGLSVVSVFVQRGELPARLPGWRRVRAGGRAVYAIDPDAQTVAWSADGYVFTVISDAPAGTADQAVASMPAPGEPDPGAPGFWTRMSRGFRRLASWANPLG
jgi:sigma-E factor negative regulatory protein RseB